jgi:polysaccharide pyruvyl transferase WcaK-like protein
MRITPKHIALFGNFGSDNLGNEASLRAMLDFIRRSRPDTQITCICYAVDKAQAEHHVTAVPIKLPFPKNRLFASINRLLAGLPFRFLGIVRILYLARSFDVFVVPGTGILDDFSERWQAMPFDLFGWSLAAKIWRRPFALVSIGAGPIHHPISRWLMTSAARMACYRSYRDTASKDYMQTLGLPVQADPVVPDLVFNLPAPECASIELRNGQPPTIGVGVMHYYGWDRASMRRSEIHETYVARVTQFICWLLEHGYRVRLLMGALSDQQSFDDVLRRVVAQCGQPAAACVISEPAHSLQELMCQIRETELIVATRFHNIVAALKVGRSVISIGYAEKNDRLLAEVGLQAFCQPIEGLDVMRLVEQFQSLFREREQFSDRIRDAAEQFGRRLEDQDTHLLEKLL